MAEDVHLLQKAALPMVSGLDRENPGSGSAGARMAGTVGGDQPCDESGVAAVRIFCRADIDELPWPATDHANFIRRLMVPMMQEGISRYVRNIDGEIFMLLMGSQVVPLLSLHTHKCQSMILSPTDLYVDALAYEFGTQKARLLRGFYGLLKIILRPLLGICSFNRVVFVNAMPLSTAFYPPMSRREITTLSRFIKQRFPDSTIVWRNIDDYDGDFALGKDLKACDYRLVYARPTYGIDTRNPQFRETNALKNDLRLAANTSYTKGGWELVNEEDIPRIASLFHQLYVDKYTPVNPIYTEDFFRLIWRERLFDPLILRKKGRIDGFIAHYVNEGRITDPFLGHDLALPRSSGVYRILTASVYQKARQQGLIVNYSAGVGQFKRLRGFRMTIEYQAVYHSHLAWYRRWPWLMFESLNGIARQVMRRVEL